jgi:hypothetical protein
LHRDEDLARSRAYYQAHRQEILANANERARNRAA